MKYRKISYALLHYVFFLTLVLASAWISLQTRSIVGFAVFWLPNPLLLGLWVRFPRLRSVYAVAGAASGFLVADLFAKTETIVTVIFTCGNLASIGVGYILLTRLSANDQRLVGLTSVLKMFCFILVASAVGGLASVAAAYLYLDFPLATAWSYWFVTDVVNYVTVLPALMAIPKSDRAPHWLGALRQGGSENVHPEKLMPLGLLVAVSIVAFFVGGPGAVTFPLPALLWCAVTYDLFTVACLTLAFGVWSQSGIATGIFLPRAQEVEQGYLQLSLHLGIAFIAICPNILVVVISSHKSLLAKFQKLASRDSLSGLPNRRSFFEKGAALRVTSTKARKSISLLMIDIDNFKSINDNHGHLAGDEAIRRVAKTIDAATRQNDVLGRIGGEEFAILASGLNFEALSNYAERIRKASATVDIGSKESRFNVTVSIGAVFSSNPEAGIDRLIQSADEALYQAKQSGRDKVVLFNFNQPDEILPP